MTKQLFAVIVLLIASRVFACEEYSPDINALYSARLIVTCKIIPGPDRKFEAEVLNVLKNDTDIEVAKDEPLKMSVSGFGSFGVKGNHYAEAYVLYLNYFNGRWSTYSESQHNYPLKKGSIPFTMNDTTFYLTVNEYRVMAREMFQVFQPENPCHYRPVMTKSDYQLRPNKSNVVAYFYKWNKKACGVQQQDFDRVEELPELAEEIRPDTTIYEYCHVKPKFIDGMDAFMEHGKANLPDSIASNAAIRDIYFANIVVEKDGSISNVIVKRTINPLHEQVMLDLVETMPRIIPGKNGGRVERCRFIVSLPIHISN